MLVVKKLYIIAGPNGAGKTTASYAILPEIFDCKEFVNADEIASGISPFNSTTVSLQAGRVMLNRINKLLEKGETFALETTLSTKSYVHFIKRAKALNYEIILLFLSLNSKELAVERVKIRVEEGGHHIPEIVIRRRFDNGLKNLFKLYIPIVNDWILVDNSTDKFKYIAKGNLIDTIVGDEIVWTDLKKKYGN